MHWPPYRGPYISIRDTPEQQQAKREQIWAARDERLGRARDPRRAYRVVDDFERELEHYTGAPHAVTVDSCTNALFLSLMWWRLKREREFTDEGVPPPTWFGAVLPKRTYVGVLQAARNAGLRVQWSDEPWHGSYRIKPTKVIDSARHFAPGCFVPGALTCLSFHAAKQLPLGRGGAILTDNAEAAEWLRAARMDGRPPGAPIEATLPRGWHCPLPPDTAARGLWILSRWVDSGYEPAPLVDEEYPDLSTLED